MNEKEINLPDYISFLYNRFIMTRVEYLIFTQDEQEAKVLRIIEWCIENERAYLYREAKATTPQGQKVEIPDIVWCPISHNFILSQLQGTIQSETTLKDILKSLLKKHFIFRGERGPGPYDAPIYTINKHLVAELTKLLPPTLDQLNMAAIMKKEREVKKIREGQKLTPYKLDPLVEKIRETINAPLEDQLLTLYSPKIAPLSRSRGSQKLPPKIYKETTKEEHKEESIPSASQNTNSSPNGDTLSLLEEMRKRLDTLEAENQSLKEKLLTAREQISTSSTQANTAVDGGNLPHQGNAQDDESTTQEADKQPSYSHPATQPELPDIPAPSEKSKGRKPSTPKEEKPKEEKTPKPTHAQIKEVYAVITKVKAKLFNDPDYCEVENDRSTKSIAKLIEAKGTPALLALVMKDMWDESENGVYWWRTNRKKMSVTAICGQYSNRASALKSKLTVVPNPSTENSPKPVVTQPSYSEQSCRPELQRYVPDMPDDVLKRVWIDPKKVARQQELAARGAW